MTGLVILRPWWLLALLPVVASALWLWRHRAAGDWAAVIDPHLLAAMRRLGHLGAGGTDPSPFLSCAAAGLLVGALAEAWLRRPDVPSLLAWSMLALVLASQALRWWCIATLGRRWNTRVIVVPGLAPVTAGPYRFLRHPNYVAVVVEGVALPLVHAAWITAVVFTVLNAGLLAVRIRTEDAALNTLPGAPTPTTEHAGA